MKLLRLILLIGVSISLLLIPVAYAQGIRSPAEVFSYANGAIFPMYVDSEDGERACTGFHIGSFKTTYFGYRGIVEVTRFINATAGHCKNVNYLRIKKGIWYNYTFAWIYTVGIFTKDSGAFTSIDWATPEKNTVLTLSTRVPDIGETLYVVGYGNRLLTERICTYTAEQEANKGSMYCNNPIRGGQSGSPVLNNEGEVVGILTHTTRLDEKYALFTKIQYVKDLLRAVSE